MSDRPPVFVHAADLHLGAPLRSLGEGLSPQAREELISQVDRAFDNLIDETIRLEAEFLVLAGDIYDGAHREAGAQIRFVDGLKRLVDKKIAVYIVHGNHDPLVGSVVNVVKVPDGVTVFKPGEVQTVRHDLRDGGHVIVAGISFATKNESENLALRFRDVQRGDARAVIGILHSNVGGSTKEHKDYAPCKESDLAAMPVDYWALGHVHRTTITSLGPNRYWAYPGNLQGRDFGETGAKGALVVQILGAGVGPPQHLPLDVFRFVSLTLDCTRMDDLDDIAAAMNAELSTKADDDQKLIVRVRLTGRSNVRAVLDQTAASKTTSIAASLSQKCTASLHGGKVTRVIDQVLPSLDIEELSSRDDLLGDMLRHIRELSIQDILAIFGESAPEDMSEEEAEQVRELMRSDILRELTPTPEVAQ